jgi:hypothetical protein
MTSKVLRKTAPKIVCILGGIWTAKIAGAERFKQFTDQ